MKRLLFVIFVVSMVAGMMGCNQPNMTPANSDNLIFAGAGTSADADRGTGTKYYWLHNPSGKSNSVYVKVYHRDPWSITLSVGYPGGAVICNGPSRSSVGAEYRICLPSCSAWRDNTAVAITVKYNNTYGDPQVYYNFSNCY